MAIKTGLETDPVIEACKKHLDRTLIRKNLIQLAKLQELDTSNVSPTDGGGSVAQMPLRADEPRPSLDIEQLLANTRDSEHRQFKIPPVFK